MSADPSEMEPKVLSQDPSGLGVMGGPDVANGGIQMDVNARGTKRPRASQVDDDDDDDERTGRERRKIEIKFIQDKSRRHITFSKRKAGIMKKAYELSVLTGTQVLLLVVSETGLVYTFTTPKLQPLVTKPEGKNLIQAYLNAPEPPHDGEDGPVESPENTRARTASAMPQPAGMPNGYAMPPSQYATYMQPQAGGAYPVAAPGQHHPQQPSGQ